MIKRKKTKASADVIRLNQVFDEKEMRVITAKRNLNNLELAQFES